VPYTGTPSGAPSSQPTGQPTSDPTSGPTAKPTSIPTVEPTGRPTSRPSERPSSFPTSSPVQQADLFVLTDYMKDTCYAGCASELGVSAVSLGSVAHRTEFCSLYSSSSCTYGSVANFSCVPKCMKMPECGSVFCTNFAWLSEVCDDVVTNWNPVSVNKRSNSCLREYSNQQAASGSGYALVSFSMTFKLPGVSAATLLGSKAAVNATKDMLLQLMNGVIEVSSLSAVDSSRRLELDALAQVHNSLTPDRILTSSGAMITAALKGIPAGPVTDPATTVNAYTSAFINSINTGVFRNVFLKSVYAYGVQAIITRSAIESVTSASVVSVGSPAFESTSAPSSYPTAAPATNDDSGLSDAEIALIVLACIVAVLLGLLGWRYRNAKALREQKEAVLSAPAAFSLDTVYNKPNPLDEVSLGVEEVAPSALRAAYESSLTAAVSPAHAAAYAASTDTRLVVSQVDNSALLGANDMEFKFDEPITDSADLRKQRK